MTTCQEEDDPLSIKACTAFNKLTGLPQARKLRGEASHVPPQLLTTGIHQQSRTWGTMKRETTATKLENGPKIGLIISP